MRVRMLSTLASPKLSANPGQEIDVSESDADRLISGGFAVPVKSVGRETAVPELPENTAILDTKKGKGKK